MVSNLITNQKWNEFFYEDYENMKKEQSALVKLMDKEMLLQILKNPVFLFRAVSYQYPGVWYPRLILGFGKPA